MDLRNRFGNLSGAYGRGIDASGPHAGTLDVIDRNAILPETLQDPDMSQTESAAFERQTDATTGDNTGRWGLSEGGQQRDIPLLHLDYQSASSDLVTLLERCGRRATGWKVFEIDRGTHGRAFPAQPIGFSRGIRRRTKSVGPLCVFSHHLFGVEHYIDERLNRGEGLVHLSTETRPGNLAVRRYKMAYNRVREALATDPARLLLYLIILAVGVMGDFVSCKLSPEQTFWAEMLPNLDYIGILFAATAFGVRAGLAAAGLAGISHALVMTTVCAQPTLELGQLPMFVLIGLIAGWMTRQRSNIAAQKDSTVIGTGERGGDRPWPELARMLPGLVHQFRTPIASIEGAGFVLDDADLSDEKRQEFVSIIRNECRRLDHLVGLLDFNQPATSEHREVDVARMLDEVIQLCRSKGGGSTIALRNAAWPEIPRLRCDPELVKQAMLNLTLDAVQNSPQGSEVVLWARSQEGEVILGLTDQRIDCRLEHLNRLIAGVTLGFEPSDVDLATVHQIVSRHGGSMRVERNAGQGITISLIFPHQQQVRLYETRKDPNRRR